MVSCRIRRRENRAGTMNTARSFSHVRITFLSCTLHLEELRSDGVLLRLVADLRDFDLLDHNLPKLHRALV